jgi:hypothetical protein
VFRRRWPSIYAALQDGRQDRDGWRRYVVGLLPKERKTLLFALDGSSWPHPQARTLQDLQYTYSPTSNIAGRPVVVGHPYSLWTWVAEPGSSWALPISVERLWSQASAAEQGVRQVQALLDQRSPLAEHLYVILGDTKYGTHHFLRPLRDLWACAQVVRLRCDRVLLRPPGPYGGRGRRDLKHGPRFAFKDPSTWEAPAAEVRFEDPQFGQVRLVA